MSYLVIARKYRPSLFSDVAGQEHITRTLKNAIKLDKISHAYLFTGQRGVGKTTTARILAKAVNCKNLKNEEPCGKCETCLEIDSSSSVDVIEIDAASNRGIDEIRELRENIKFAPAKSKYKIYIIDEVHMLTTQAFNALLKSLEEPPEHIIFIMATTEPDKVLETITSRCQSFNFKPINEAVISSALKEIAVKENADYDEEGLLLIARSAGGSMRDAQSIMDQALSYSSGKLKASEISGLLGIVPGKLLFKLTDYIKNEDPAGALGYCSKLYSKGYSPGRLHKDLLSHFRNLMLTSVLNNEKDFFEISKDYCRRLGRAAEGFSGERLLWITDFIEKNTYRIKHADFPRIVMDTIIFKLSEKFVSFEDVMDAVARQPEQKMKSKEHRLPGDNEECLNNRQQSSEEKDLKEPEAPLNEEPTPEVKEPQRGGKWAEILKLIKRESQPLYHTLKEAKAFLKGKTVVIKNPSLLEIKDNKSILLKEKIRQVLGNEFNFSVENTPAPAEKKSPENKVRSSQRFNPIEIEEEEPVVADIIEEFGGQIEEQFKREK